MHNGVLVSTSETAGKWRLLLARAEATVNLVSGQFKEYYIAVKITILKARIPSTYAVLYIRGTRQNAHLNAYNIKNFV